VRASQGKVVGDLVIGCSTAAGKYILPHLLARFKRTYPDVRMSIMVVSRRDAMEGVCAGSYDLVDTSLRLSEYDVEYLDFFTDHLSLIVPVSHPWARQDAVKPEELFSEQFICREPEAACRKIVGEALAKHGLDMNNLQIVMEIGSAEAQAMAVEYGMGLAFVSLAAAMPRVALGRLATVRVDGMELLSPIEFVRCPVRPSSAVQIRFLDFVNNPQTRSQIEMLTKGLVV
jgi:DNA-binding transcriptional LysR family regulator